MVSDDPGIALDRDQAQAFSDEPLSIVDDRVSQLLDENRRLREALALSSKEVDAEAMASVAHDLKAPVATMLTWIAVLRATNDEPVRRRALSALEEAAMQQGRLVTDLIEAARGHRATHLSLSLEAVDLGALCLASAEAAAPIAAALRVSVWCSPSRGVVVTGDRGRLRQVIDNLVHNALRFVAPGGRVEVSAGRDEESCWVRVADDGSGIDPAFLPCVFEPFAQGNGGRREALGLGLGLSIVKRLVELHGGVVRAESEGPGHGARFVFRLPPAR